MENIKSYEKFNDYIGENWDADSQKTSLMSDKAKSKMKKLCEKHLMKEANECHNDLDECHTYDNYVNECHQVLDEMLGQEGYEAVSKDFAK